MKRQYSDIHLVTTMTQGVTITESKEDRTTRNRGRTPKVKYQVLLPNQRSVVHKVGLLPLSILLSVQDLLLVWWRWMFRNRHQISVEVWIDIIPENSVHGTIFDPEDNGSFFHFRPSPWSEPDLLIKISLWIFLNSRLFIHPKLVPFSLVLLICSTRFLDTVLPRPDNLPDLCLFVCFKVS